MKKILCVIYLIVAILMFGACGEDKVSQPTNSGLQPKLAANTSHWQKIVKDNEIKIGVPSLENSFCNELIDAFDKELNIPVKKIKAENTSDIKEMLENGEIDMYWGLYPKEAPNSLDFSFSAPYLTTTAVFITDSKAFGSLDKNDQIVGVLKNSAEEFLVTGNYSNVKTYNSYKELWDALIFGRLTTVAINKCDYEKSKYSSFSKYDLSDTQMYNLVIAFKDGYTDLATEIDKTVAKIKASGIASEICEKWYGKDLISK